MLLAIFTVALFIVIIAAAARLCRPKRGAQTAEEQEPAYSTVLRMSRELGGGELGCRDGVIYYRGSEIGRYFHSSFPEGWRVRDAERCDIGYFTSTSNGTIAISLTLYGLAVKSPLLQAKAAESPRGMSWFAAMISSSLDGYILSPETYDTLADYSGDPVEASAAFICWAKESSGNIYSDYYRL